MKLKSVQFKDAIEFPWNRGMSATFMCNAERDDVDIQGNEGWIFMRAVRGGETFALAVPVVNIRQAVPMAEAKK